jgi:hypothetical protein
MLAGPCWARPGCVRGRRGYGGLDPEGYEIVRFDRRRWFLHRVVMQVVLGRELLPSEVVHHRDGNRTNNSPRNLAVLDQGEHTSKHKRKVPVVGYCDHCGEAYLAKSGARFCSRLCSVRYFWAEVRAGRLPAPSLKRSRSGLRSEL